MFVSQVRFPVCKTCRKIQLKIAGILKGTQAGVYVELIRSLGSGRSRALDPFPSPILGASKDVPPYNLRPCIRMYLLITLGPGPYI